MRKILGLFCLLALCFGVSVSSVSGQGTTRRSVPMTTSGSPVPAGSIKLLGPDHHSLASFKAQNHLTAALIQRLAEDRADLGGNPNDPGIKNGTVDTVPYFNSWFKTVGTRNSGRYPYSMVGQSPAAGGTTGINNQVIPLITVLAQSGVALYAFDPTAANDPQGSDISLVEQSPLYDATTTYPGNGGSLPADTGQVVDTAQRAEFSGVRTADWHTPLNPAMSSGIVWIQFLEWNNGDWACVGGEAPPCTSFPVVNINTISNNFAFILNAEAPANSTFPIIVTDFVTAFIPGPGGGCCVLGYHNAQPGIVDPAGVLVWTWGTFIPHNGSNGFSNPFGGFGFDTMVLSHEIAETYNDPFVQTTGTLVAPWVDGSVTFAQENLEVGDAIEAMMVGDVIYNYPGGVPLMPNGNAYNYNLQNVALLQWFTRTPLNSVGGIYSWPNTNTLNQCAHGKGGGNTPTWCYGEGSAGFFFGPPW
jgi:hypothetical protein